MANVKISAMPEATDLTDAVIPIVQAGANKQAPIMLFSMVNPVLVPHAGGGQASAAQLSYGYTLLSNVGSANDSVALPEAVAGAFVQIAYFKANGPQYLLYCQIGTDELNGLGNTTAFDLANNGEYFFTCATDGEWSGNVVDD